MKDISITPVMKIKNTFNLLFLSLIVSALLYSCRSESDIFINASDDQALAANSKAANLMSRVAMNDGSIDNIIDNSSNFTVQLPVTVIANGSEVIINSAEDFRIIEDIFAEFNNDQDSIEFIFPITIIFRDYTETEVSSSAQLESIIENSDSELDNLECVDFNYPFNITVFNRISELVERTTINDDKELFEFIEDLTREDVATVEFPITLILADNSEQIISDLETLESIIEDSIDSCDDNDATTDIFTDTIVQGSWEVQKYKDDNSNETQNYRDYIFTYFEDGTVRVVNTNTSGDDDGGGEITFGTWSLTVRSDGGLNVVIDLGTESPLDRLNNTWNVKKVQDNRIMLDDRNDDNEVSKDELFFKKL